MCDCYSAPCDGCGKVEISLHVADFCTPRDNVHPYCPTCIETGAASVGLDLRLLGSNEWEHISKGEGSIPIGNKRVFLDIVTDYGLPFTEEDAPFDGAKPGDKVLIVCDDPEAYGIHLN